MLSTATTGTSRRDSRDSSATRFKDRDENPMADLVKFTIDGRELEAPAGTLVIEAAKHAGFEIPSFCYYEGYSLQAACRMCLVEVEKMGKLQVACTLPVGNGMVIHTDSPLVKTARKYT